jgi:hypothetical protein
MEIYIIHNTKITERKNLVKKIQKKTNAKIFPAILMKNGVEGCHKSHKSIYEFAQKDVLVFEDDCEIMNDNFLEPLDFKNKYDLIYLGINKKLIFGSYGTHAMWISEFAKKCFMDANQPITTGLDLSWNNIEMQYKLKTYRPDPINKYVQQKQGLRSIITNRIRTGSSTSIKINKFFL